MPKLPEGYRIETVYGRLTQPQAAEIVRFWMQQGVISTIEEARRRVHQVVDVMRNEQGEIVGLNSVYPATYKTPQDVYLFYRLYIRAQDRVPGLARYATEHVAIGVKSRPDLLRGIKGLIAVTENPKLTREAARRQLKRIGFEYDGRGPKGYDIWRMDIAEASPSQPPPHTISHGLQPVANRSPLGQVGEEQKQKPQAGEEQKAESQVGEEKKPH